MSTTIQALPGLPGPAEPQRCGSTEATPDWQILAERLKAVADPTRLRLLAALAARPGEQACVSDLAAATALPQPMVSHHLQILRRATVVSSTRRGSRVIYRLDRPALDTIAEKLAQL